MTMTVTTGRILIVDDDHATLRLYSSVLERAGFQVQHIRQGRTALTLVESESYSLIVLDLHMPEVDGLALLRHLRSLDSETPVLILSGTAIDQDVIQAVRLGIQGLLLKPFAAETLIDAVRVALAQSNERRIRNAARLLRPLLALGTRAENQHDLGTLYAALLDLLRDEVQVDHAALLLSSHEKLQAVPAATLAMSGQFPAQALPVGGLLERGFQGSEALVLPAEHLATLAPLLAEGSEPGSAVLAPLLANNERLGLLLAVRSSNATPFSDDDCALIELLAEHVAAMTRNQRLQERRLATSAAAQEETQQRAQAEKLSAVARMTAAIAHEINNPLQAIHNSLHLLLTRTLTPEKQQRYLEMAQQEVDGLIMIVRRTLDFYQSSEEGLRPVALTDVLEGALAAATPQLDDGKIQLRREWPQNLPPVQAVTNHLRQALVNIVLNAIEAMPSGGVLTLRAECLSAEEADLPASSSHPWVLIEIGDTGQGIRPDQLSYIFEPFYSTKLKSLGLGLTISYNIIARHGGDLRVRSTPGEHAIFSIRLPAAEMS